MDSRFVNTANRACSLIYSYIKKYNQGEALFVCGNRRMQVDVIVSDDELDSFGSGGGL